LRQSSPRRRLSQRPPQLLQRKRDSSRKPPRLRELDLRRRQLPRQRESESLLKRRRQDLPPKLRE